MLLHGLLKRAVMARLADLTDPGDPLHGVQVATAMPPEPERLCVFAGRARFVRREVTDMRAGLFEHTVTFEIRIRVVELGGDIDAAEKIGEDIAAAVAAAVSAGPSLVGTAGTIAVTGGDSDPTVIAPSPEPSVTVNQSVTVTAVVVKAGA